MIDQKGENLLNLALAATEVERRRVPELSAGYNSYSKTWEVIVQYQGDLAFSGGAGGTCNASAVFVCHSSGTGVSDGLRDGTAADYVSGKTKTFVFRGCVYAEHILYYTCAGGDFRSVWGMGCCLHALIQAWTMRILISAHRTGQAELQFYGIRRFREIHRRGMHSDRCIHGGRSMRHLHLLRRKNGLPSCRPAM